MSYCCDQSNGLGALARVYGLGSMLLPPIHYGARFSLGVELDGWGVTHNDLEGDLRQIQQALLRSDYVAPGVKVYRMSGALSFNPFIVIEGGSGREYGSASDLQDAVLSVIGGLFEFDAGSVRFEAQTYNPTTGAEDIRRYDAPLGGGASKAPGAGSGPGILDTVSQSLGLPKAQTQTILIGGGVLLAVLLLRR